MGFVDINTPNQSFILLINAKMQTIVGILTFMSRINNYIEGLGSAAIK